MVFHYFAENSPNVYTFEPLQVGNTMFTYYHGVVYNYIHVASHNNTVQILSLNERTKSYEVDIISQILPTYEVAMTVAQEWARRHDIMILME